MPRRAYDHVNPICNKLTLGRPSNSSARAKPAALELESDEPPDPKVPIFNADEQK